jgi:hypothetical protein
MSLMSLTNDEPQTVSLRDAQLTLGDCKGTSGKASESLTEPARRHLATWPQLRPDLPVGGVVLIVNHQARTYPLDRTQSPYNRPEFVASLTFPVLSTTQLYGWWRRGEYAAIRSALFGDAARSTDNPVPRPGVQQPQTTLVARRRASVSQRLYADRAGPRARRLAS